MSKTIVWVAGIALVIGAALTTLETNAAVGDVVYKRFQDQVQIIGTPLTDMGTFVGNVFPGVTAASLSAFTCARHIVSGDIYCVATEETTVTISDMIDSIVAGNTTATQVVSENGTNAVMRSKKARTLLTGGQKSNLANWAMDNLGVANINTLMVINCNRNDGVFCQAIDIVTATPQAFAVDVVAQKVQEVVGRVE